MAGDEDINIDSDSPDNFEAAVLELLNREMAAAQLPRKETCQSGDLEALISDLLNQVLIATNRSQSVQAAPLNNMDNPHMEFPPEETPSRKIAD
jgi:hypothetical protein